jgi:hypothetical protein
MQRESTTLVQVLLPVYDPAGVALPPELFARVRAELTQRFGGVTAWVRSPARGVWKDEDGSVERDDVVLYEVVVETLDREWWSAYRERLRREFRQEELLVRALPAELL